MIRREKHILSNEEGERYHFAVNRYHLLDEKTLSSLSAHSTSGILVTLVLAHALGLHKETWEPFLEEISTLQLNDARLRKNGMVSEAWSVDCPSHGDGAILNERRLVDDDTFHSSVEYAQSIMTLLVSPIFVSARNCRLVLVGHSGGACAAALVMRECVRKWGVKSTPFHSFVIMEIPVLATPLSPLQERNTYWTNIGKMLSQFANSRRDKWNSIEEAYDWLSKKHPYKAWDPRALRCYVESGLRPLPTAFYPNEASGYTLKCHKLYESRPFGGHEETATAAAILEEFHPHFPVHVVFGQLSPFRPPEKDIPLLVSRKGKNSFYASVADVPGVNHLLVQEAPEKAARAMLATINVQRISADTKALETGQLF